MTLLDVGCGLSSVGSLAALGLWVLRKDSRALYATMGAGWLLSLLFMSRTGVSMLHLLVRGFQAADAVAGYQTIYLAEAVAEACSCNLLSPCTLARS